MPVPKGREWGISGFASSLGLRLDVAQPFFSAVVQMLERRTVPRLFPMELPVRPIDVQRELSWDDGGAEYPDGLAYFGQYFYLTLERAGTWSPTLSPSARQVDPLVRFTHVQHKYLER